MNHSMPGRFAALSLITLLLLVLLPLADAADKAKAGPKVSPAVGKPLNEAIKSSDAGNQDEALLALEKAKLVAKTPFEKFQVSEVYASVYSKQKNMPALADAIETSLSLDQYPADIRNQRLNLLCQLRYTAKVVDAAITACERALKEAGPNTETYILIAQMYRSKKMYAESSAAIDSALKGGRNKDSEALLELQFNNYLALKDAAGQRKTLEDLIAVKPQKDYWDRLLTIVEQKLPPKSRLDLDIDRVRQITGVMERPDEYLEMAQYALDAGLPGEAQSVLTAGAGMGVFNTAADKSRQAQLAAKAKVAAADDLRSLPKFDKEAALAKDGKKDLVLGQAYVNYGRYDEGIAAIKRAMTKGGIDAGEGQLRLGQALFASGKKPEAQQAFDAVPATSRFAPIANLWSVHTRASSN